jgi:hypothetical protein
MVLARTETDFRSAGRLGETLTGARVTRIGKTAAVRAAHVGGELRAVIIEARLTKSSSTTARWNRSRSPTSSSKPERRKGKR